MSSRPNLTRAKAIERGKISNYVSLGGAEWVFGKDLHHFCRFRSPDDEMQCGQLIGHVGLHQNGNSTWYGAAWFTRRSGYRG